MSKKYSLKTGFGKSLKNCLVVLAPAFLAFLAGLPEQYTPLASLAAYFVKNYLENK